MYVDLYECNPQLLFKEKSKKKKLIQIIIVKLKYNWYGNDYYVLYCNDSK